MAGHNRIYAKGRLVGKHKEDGIKGLVPGTPGSQDYYKTEYEYMQDGKVRTYRCYILGEPPVEVQIKTGFLPSLAGDIAVRASRSKRGFLSYSDADSITPRMLLLAFLPFILAMLIFIIMCGIK